MSKINNVLRAIWDMSRFSNCFELILSKIFSKISNGSNILVYKYKGFKLVSLESYGDGVGIRECLGEGVYNEALEKARPKTGLGTYLNIGANVGAFDIAINDTWGRNTKGIAVEMNPWTCARLLSNICYNHLFTRVINAAVTEKTGYIRIDVEKSGTGQSIYHSVCNGNVQDVRSLALSDIPNPASGVAIDLLKVDCEGAEYAIFAAMPPESFERFRNIVMEIHSPPDGFLIEQLIDEIRSKGQYKIMKLGQKHGAPLMLFYKVDGDARI